MKITQRQAILNYLLKHKKGITSKDAFEKFGCTRLSGQIFELKKKGHNIVTEYEVVKTRYGRGVEIARYKLEA